MRAQAPPKTHARPVAARDPGAGARPLRARAQQAKDARVAADIAENAIETIAGAEAIGRFESLSPSRTLRHGILVARAGEARQGARRSRSQGQIAVDHRRRRRDRRRDGAAFAGAKAPRSRSSTSTRRGARPRQGAGRRRARRSRCDVTDAGSVRAAFDRVVERFGGVDILVSNAGAAWQGRIGEVDGGGAARRASSSISSPISAWRRRRCAIMLAQGTGGALLFNVSKQAVNPGPDFGPYGLPKAATLFLVRQYALDYGADGIRANAVNADRMRSGLLTDAMIASRAKARGLSESDYMAGNLLGREVTAEDVAQAFLHHARRAQDHGRRHHRRRRQHRRGAALSARVARRRVRRRRLRVRLPGLASAVALVAWFGAGAVLKSLETMGWRGLLAAGADPSRPDGAVRRRRGCGAAAAANAARDIAIVTGARLLRDAGSELAADLAGGRRRDGRARPHAGAGAAGASAFATLGRRHHAGAVRAAHLHRRWASAC